MDAAGSEDHAQVAQVVLVAVLVGPTAHF